MIRTRLLHHEGVDIVAFVKSDSRHVIYLVHLFGACLSVGGGGGGEHGQCLTHQSFVTTAPSPEVEWGYPGKCDILILI